MSEYWLNLSVNPQTYEAEKMPSEVVTEKKEGGSGNKGGQSEKGKKIEDLGEEKAVRKHLTENRMRWKNREKKPRKEETSWGKIGIHQRS